MREIQTFSTAQLSEQVSRKTTSLHGSEYALWLDRWFFALSKAPNLEKGDVLPLTQVKKRVDGLLHQGSKLAFWSGGFI